MEDIPQNLRIVAWLFIIGSIFAALDVFISFLNGRININLGILAYFIGRGLLDLNSRSLKWAMVFTWLGLILLPVMMIMFLFTSGNLTILGANAGQAPPGLGFVLAAISFAVTVWQFRVLTSDDIRNLFTHEDAT